MTRPLAALLALSGAAALTCEVVWLRRLALLTGSAGVATTLTLALYMAGLGLGGLAAAGRRWRRAPAGYGALELGAAAWAALFPMLLGALSPLALRLPGLGGAALLAGALLLPPALLHGATLPAAAAAARGPREAALLYAANTAGAVVGTLAAAWLWLPLLGVRGTEALAACGSALAGLGALALAARAPAGEAEEGAARRGNVPAGALAAAAVAGASALALEGAWARLAALLLGGSVYAFSLVLAVFLAGIALGAEVGRRRGAAALQPALALLGLLAVAGTALYRALPHGLALAWQIGGPSGQLPFGALLLAAAMAGAPVASGVVFAAALQAAPRCPPARAAGQVAAANTAGAVIGAAGAGLWGMPVLGVKGVVLAGAALAVGTAAILSRDPRVRWGAPALLGALALASPRWDPALYAVGLYGRLSEFVDFSPRAVERFAREGWVLRYYVDGRAGTVAVGESLRTGNRWLSLNGKVDASTGDDMPTQQLSGRLPVAIARAQAPEGDLPVLVVGLASGVTAGEALASGATALTVVELEPAVESASRLFDHVNGRVLEDPRTKLVLSDARSELARPGPAFGVIISEPSNPWIAGVGSLFTVEYWTLAQRRLRPGGVFCQWVQLYALPPEALRSLVRSFLEVFPRAWLFETIPGADALLVAAPGLPEGLPLEPTLDPAGLGRLAEGARMHTDDRPWIEFEAPRWLHRSTSEANAALIAEAAVE